MTVFDSTIAGNSSNYFGGGVANDTSGTLTLTDSTLSNNSATDDGGGIFNFGTLTVTDSTLSKNSGIYGGGIFNDGTLTVTDSTLSGNSATTDDGGGIDNAGTLTVTDSTLSGNSANHYGGGIDNVGTGDLIGTVTVTDSTLSGNSASDGGGIYNSGSGTLTLTDSTLSGNSATKDGGGIDNVSSGAIGTVTVIDSTLSGNSATNNGGGICNSTSVTLTLTGGTLAGNSATTGVGGGIYTTGTTTLNNTIVAGNIPWEVSGSVTANSSLIENSTGATIIGGDGKNLLDENPLLGTLGNYGGPTQTIPLLPGSPAIDAGSNVLAVDTSANLLTTDQRGYARIVNGTVDIGAIEKLSSTVIWSNPADISYGTALDSTQLDAAAGVLGTFVYTPASGSVLHAGSNQTLSVLFTPTDTIDYTTATASVSINVSPVPLWVTADSQTKVVSALCCRPSRLATAVSSTATQSPA